MYLYEAGTDTFTLTENINNTLGLQLQNHNRKHSHAINGDVYILSGSKNKLLKIMSRSSLL